MNINKFEPVNVKWFEPKERLTFGMPMSWWLPIIGNRSGGDFSKANIVSHRWCMIGNGPAWLWSASIMAPRTHMPMGHPTYWEEYPMMFQVRRGVMIRDDAESNTLEQIRRPTRRFTPVNDHRAFPTVILIDAKGWIVPWLDAEELTGVKVLFLSQKLDKFAFLDHHAMLALQFLEGRYHGNNKDLGKFRRRLQKLCDGVQPRDPLAMVPVAP